MQTHTKMHHDGQEAVLRAVSSCSKSSKTFPITGRLEWRSHSLLADFRFLIALGSGTADS